MEQPRGRLQRRDLVTLGPAWRNVIAGFLSTFVVFGVIYSFGTFFSAMAADFGSGSAATSMLFSLTTFACYVLGAVTGHLLDSLGPRRILIAGAIALSTGLALTAGADRLWVTYITYGLGVGLAVACGYVPMVATVSAWFDRGRATALGVAVSGIGVGTLVVAPVAGALIERFGWRTAFVQIGVGGALLLLVAAALASSPPGLVVPERGRGMSPAARSPAFAAMYLSMLFGASAMFVPIVYLAPYAQREGSSVVAAGALIGVIGVSSVLARLILGMVADRLGSLVVYQGCYALVSLSMLLWLASPTYAWLAVFAVLFGLGYGGFATLAPAVLADTFGVDGIGGVMGLLYTSAGLAGLLSPPAAGAVLDATSSYTGPILGAMVVAALGFAALLPLSRLSSHPRVGHP
jgi:MFS family permease